MRCWVIYCDTATDRVIHVRAHPVSWPTCADHGRMTIEMLMSIFPRQGVYTRKVGKQ